MKWLVIGASSFTGQHFCELLKTRSEPFDTGNLRSLHWVGSVDADTIVVNFAAVNVVAPSWDKPGKYMKVNVGRVTEAVQGMLDKHRPSIYVHISTPEVYGSTHGLVDEAAPFSPSTPYAVSRASAELMLNCYRNQYDFPVVFTRSCNVYGPGQQLYRLIPKVIACCKNGTKFPLEGNGTSIRSFVYVSDLCRAIYRIAGQGDVGSAYHISGELPSPIAGIVQMICSMMGKDPDAVIEPKPERPGKDAAYLLDDSRVRSLGWSEEIPLGLGVANVIRWMEDNWEIVRLWPMEYKG